MPGRSSRVCSWALGALINACKRGTGPDLFISSGECSSLVRTPVSRYPGVLEGYRGFNSGYSTEIRSKSLGRVGIIPATDVWKSNLPAFSFDTNVEVVSGCAERGTSYSLTGSTIPLCRNFASSTSHSISRRVQKTGSKSTLKRKDKTRFNPHGGTGGGRQFRSKDSKEPFRQKSFSRARSSEKDTQSEATGGISHTRNARLKTTHRSGRKRVSPSVRSDGRLGQSIGTKERGKPRLWRKLKAEERLDVHVEGVIKRRRKRIRPRPKDITFKRGLDSDAPEIGLPVPVPEQKAVEDKPLSANAKFRQTEPSRELVRQIEENLLGRRRLVEWRRAGFDPSRTAPLDDVPKSKDRRAPIQETVFRQKLTFIAAAKIASSLPSTQYTEIAFAGRSNVGKSSLINALTRQWGVARTSDKPGLTQSINFFSLGSDLCLVDLPGYGFAFAKAHVKEDWEELVKEYVTSRANLKRVCLLVDAKWGLKPRDHELLQLMESSRTRFQILLTKTDVLPPLDLARRSTQILQTLRDHRCLVQPLMMVSSKSGAGIPHLRASLARVVSGHSRSASTGQDLASKLQTEESAKSRTFPDILMGN